MGMMSNHPLEIELFCHHLLFDHFCNTDWFHDLKYQKTI